MKIRRVLKWGFITGIVVLVIWIFIAYWTSTNDCDSKTGAPVHPMKAIRYCEYGSPDEVLKLDEIEKPVPNANQLLVKVRAASVNPLDLSTRGQWLIRLIKGFGPEARFIQTINFQQLVFNFLDHTAVAA